MASQVGDIQTQVHSVDSKVDEMKAMMAIAPAHRGTFLPWGEMPMKPRHFRGRNVIVEEVSKLLTSSESTQISILGPGGMGKTSVALAVMEHGAVRNKFSKNCFWVPCIGATSPSLLLAILYSSLRITRDTNDTLADIRNELQASPVPECYY